MAMLSNAGKDFASYYRQGVLGEFFEHVVVSSELGTLKPEAGIFEALVAGLNVTADKIVFVDDREENIRGATAVGLVGHLFTTAKKLRAHLEDLAGESATRPRPLGTPLASSNDHRSTHLADDDTT